MAVASERGGRSNVQSEHAAPPVPDAGNPLELPLGDDGEPLRPPSATVATPTSCLRRGGSRAATKEKVTIDPTWPSIYSLHDLLDGEEWTPSRSASHARPARAESAGNSDTVERGPVDDGTAASSFEVVLEAISQAKDRAEFRRTREQEFRRKEAQGRPRAAAEMPRGPWAPGHAARKCFTPSLMPLKCAHLTERQLVQAVRPERVYEPDANRFVLASAVARPFAVQPAPLPPCGRESPFPGYHGSPPVRKNGRKRTIRQGQSGSRSARASPDLPCWRPGRATPQPFECRRSLFERLERPATSLSSRGSPDATRPRSSMS
eukprot:TRINITY_DN29392_c0_g1_i1.p1 TRINITY_DN29392_c0_g1~~TRINITY_DN29392_c0_g1_i1.p1  ORF type:complete len:320 (-),score=45.58 TRINITY_DN29392_c0_g1_i1:232-1191(-)